MTPTELMELYDAAMRHYASGPPAWRNAHHRAACEVGYAICEAGLGEPIDIPETVEERLDDLTARGVTDVAVGDAGRFHYGQWLDRNALSSQCSCGHDCHGERACADNDCNTEDEDTCECQVCGCEVCQVADLEAVS